MTVYKIGKNKIKIALSDSEVLSYFGSYEEIALMSKSIRATIGSLLKESLTNYGFAGKDKKFLIELEAKENSGCGIIITFIEKDNIKKRNLPEIYMLEFSDTESMINGILYLYRSRKYRHTISSLFEMSSTYRLIINLSASKGFPFAINEYCFRQSTSPFEKAYTEEYGKLLIADKAIEELGRTFSKSS